MTAAGPRGSGAAGQRGDAAPLVSPLQALPADFVGSFPDPLVRLEPALPEVAFIGRSNVGKSSLLNALLGRPGFARVSGTPGKTTLLNAFRLPSLYLVDLPGYGFARAGKTARAGYRRLVTRYLRERPTLAGVVWLLDVRHAPSKDDLEMQQLLIDSGRPVLVALTKSDKLTRTAGLTRARDLAAGLGLEEDQVEMVSVKSGLGIAELGASILATAGGGR
ncbi:MAG TPA: ribosome biogenesis GTP-binding protein YihA/YsxC [Gemmatimonadales bacterium]|jgi:GTP-binding protein|nr:ribosome biogenesis GTP-binding protein YihA/YsxC [Gemmatimonadales bacterium]